MALHTHLPIHKAAYDLLDVIVELARNIPRDFKQSFGGTLRDECIEIHKAIYRANCAQDKVPHLDQLIERLQVVELLLRLGRDKQLISTKGYAAAVALTNSIGKQAGGWRKYAASPAA